MQDMIIKNTGNSRLLRSVANFMTLYPTYEAFVQALVAGTLPVDIGGPNAAGVQQMGTAVNKANLLTDATEVSLWGNAANRMPNQALQQLRALITAAQNTANGRVRLTTGTYLGTGEWGVDHPNSLTFPFDPQLLFIFNQKYNGGSPSPFTGIFMRDVPIAIYVDFQTGSSWPLNPIEFVTWGSNKVEWYIKNNNHASAAKQLNAKNGNYLYEYKYVAIG